MMKTFKDSDESCYRHLKDNGSWHKFEKSYTCGKISLVSVYVRKTKKDILVAFNSLEALERSKDRYD